MAKTKAKRLLSLLLALAMVLSLTVTPVYAADDDTASGSGTSETGETVPEPEQADEDTEADALEEDASEEVTSDQQEDLNAGISLASTEDGEETVTLPNADASGVITLTGDVALTGQYTVKSGDTVTIDLGDYSITHGTGNGYYFLIVVESNAKLTIKGNGTIEGGIYVNGEAEIQGGTISPTNCDCGVYVNGGTVTVSGGTISSTYSDGSTYGIDVGNGGTVTVSGGKIETTYGIYVGGNSKATVSGGTISAKYGVCVGSGSLEVKDGATITGSNRAVEVGSTSASATISGGTLTGGTYAVMNFGGTLNISGGNISGTNTGIYHSSGTTTVTGGTIYGKSYGAKVYGGTLNASGGSISCGERTNAWAYGIYVDSSNSAATVTLSGDVEVTANNTVGYGAAVVLFNTINGEDSTSGVVTTLNVQDNATLSGSSYGISGNGSYSGNQVTVINISGGTITGEWGIYHPEMGTMTITGGTITGSTTGIEIRAGSLTVSGGTITGNGSPNDFEFNGSGTTIIGAGIGVSQHTTNQEIDVTITGGEISGYYGVFEVNTNANNTEKVSISISGDAEVTSTSDDGAAVYSVSVSGAEGLSSDASGYYTNGNTDVSITGGTYSTDVTAYCAEGSAAVSIGEDSYIIVSTGTVAVVYDADENLVGSYISLKDAYKAVGEGGTMILVADVSGEQLGASTNKAVTLDLNGHTISNSSGSVIANSNGTLTIKDSSQTESSIGTGKVEGSGNVALKVTGGNVVLESGTLASTSTYAVTQSGGTLTVKGGKVSAASNANCVVYYTNGTLKIEGGLFTGDSESVAIVNAGSSATKDEDNVQVAISGGVFQTYRPLRGTAINLEITGGYFASNYSIGDYIPGGYGYTTVESYTYLGVECANYYQVTQTNFTLKVGSVESYHKTLTAAVNAAITAYNENSEAAITITMNNDCETGKVPVEKAVVFTLDLNGHTLTSTDKGVLKITSSDATVTIKDSDTDGTGTITTVDSPTSPTTTGLFQVSSGTLNIESGNFNQNAGQDLIAGSGDVNITGGYFTSDPSEYTGTYEVAINEDEAYPYYVADVIVGRNIDLKSGVITMNVYIAGAKDSSSMNVTPEATTNVATVASNTNTSIEADYVLSQPVVARKMADEWTVTVTLSNGYVVEYATSVQNYAETLLNTDGTSDAVKSVLTAMLDYGAAVQKVAGYNDTALANSSATGDTYNDLSNITASAMKAAGVTKKTDSTATTSSTLTLSSVGMVFDYDFSVVLTYSAEVTSATVTNESKTTSYTATPDGTTVTISGLSASDLNQILTITVSNDTGTNVTNMSGLYYARLVAGDVSSDFTAKQTLGRTLYLYSTTVYSLSSNVDAYVEG